MRCASIGEGSHFLNKLDLGIITMHFIPKSPLLMTVGITCLIFSCVCVPMFEEKSLPPIERDQAADPGSLIGSKSAVNGSETDRRRKRGAMLRSRLSQAEQEEALLVHQILRANEGASNMEYLYWDETLADYAQEYADSCVWGHGQPSRTDADWSNDYIGQNLYFHSNDYTIEHAIGRWYEEKENYDYERQKCVSGVCGHYTQLTWAHTEKVGCAKTECSNLVSLATGRSIGHAFYFVCNYGPGGNVRGMSVFKKGPSCSQCDGKVFWCYDDLCRDCSAHGITDQCECADGCVHGTPDPSSCTCLTCDPGWIGDTCDEPCRNLHPNCGVTRGWKEKHCTIGRNTATVQWYCPMLCGLCEKGRKYVLAETVAPPIESPAPSTPESETIIVPLYSIEEAGDLSDSSIEWTLPPYYPADNEVLTHPCHVRGVLRLTPPTWAKAVQLKITIREASGWVYNLADTNCQGEWGLSCREGVPHSAEFNQHGQTMIGFRSGGDGNFFTAVESGQNRLVTIRLNRFFFGVAKDDEIMYNQCGDFGFAFDELWLGINRIVPDSDGVPTSPDGVGSGACNLEVTWQQNEYLNCDGSKSILSELDLN